MAECQLIDEVHCFCHPGEFIFTDDTVMSFDGMKVLTALALILMILAPSYHIFTDGF